jgi:hypothetical protein
LPGGIVIYPLQSSESQAWRVRLPGAKPSSDARENVMKNFVTTQELIDERKPGSEKEPTSMQRRALIGGAVVALLSSPGAMAQGNSVHNDPFVLLLKGVYEPVAHGPNLGLHTVNLNDGSYSTTLIYPVSGIPGHPNVDKAIGRFYVQFAGDSAVYHVPGGSLAMRFTSGGLTPTSDGQGGVFLNGTFELAVVEATGIYQAFVGGHNHMVDRLHKRADGSFDEYCFCFISPA